MVRHLMNESRSQDLAKRPTGASPVLFFELKHCAVAALRVTWVRPSTVNLVTAGDTRRAAQSQIPWRIPGAWCIFRVYVSFLS